MPMHIIILDLLINGRGADVDKKRATHYYELAAMRGNSMARHNLGSAEAHEGNWDRALKHFMISAKDGGTRFSKLHQIYVREWGCNKR